MRSVGVSCMQPVQRTAVSDQLRELWKYGRILGLEMWHTPVPLLPFRNTAVAAGAEEGIASATAVTRCLHLYSGYDGTMYLSPQAIRLSTLPELEFVCRNIFRYNQIVRRHRPFAKLRHVVLGCDSATRAKAENIQRVINNRYPECVVLVPFQHLYRVKRRETSNG